MPARWQNADRRACLAAVSSRLLKSISGWRMDFSAQLRHPYLEGLIQEWIADDRAQSEAVWRMEQCAMHALHECGRVRGRFNATDREVFFAKQPEYYLDGIGLDCRTFTPFAKIRLASSPQALHVFLGDSLRGLSRNRRHKVIRYGKPLPPQFYVVVDSAAAQAVRHYKQAPRT